ncbi:MAG: iron-sulfur cluster-binding domain-containing protein [bacterium]
MSISRYWPLLRDIRTVARSFSKQHSKTPGGEYGYYRVGQASEVLGRLHPERLQVNVIAVREETHDSKTLTLAAAEGRLPSLAPGQHVLVHLNVQGVATSRPMTPTALPFGNGNGSGNGSGNGNGNGSIEITIKRKPFGLVSPYLVDHVGLGETLFITGPEGDDHYNPVRDRGHCVFIAGGVGITAYMTVIEHVLGNGSSDRVSLLYGMRTERDIIFGDRLQRLQSRYPGRFHVALLPEHAPGSPSEPGQESSAPPRRIDGPFIRDTLPEELRDASFFVCGPAAMNEQVQRALLEWGVRQTRIRVGAYGAHDDITTAAGWPAAIPGRQTFQLTHVPTGAELQAHAAEPVLHALERAGTRVSACCRSGHCGSCRMRLVHGQVFTAPGIERRPSDLQYGHINTCVSYPISDLVVDPG